MVIAWIVSTVLALTWRSCRALAASSGNVQLRWLDVFPGQTILTHHLPDRATLLVASDEHILVLLPLEIRHLSERRREVTHPILNDLLAHDPSMREPQLLGYRDQSLPWYPQLSGHDRSTEREASKHVPAAVLRHVSLLR